jgi:hypothetical protein
LTFWLNVWSSAWFIDIGVIAAEQNSGDPHTTGGARFGGRFLYGNESHVFESVFGRAPWPAHLVEEHFKLTSPPISSRLMAFATIMTMSFCSTPYATQSARPEASTKSMFIEMSSV